MLNLYTYDKRCKEGQYWLFTEERCLDVVPDLSSQIQVPGTTLFITKKNSAFLAGAVIALVALVVWILKNKS